MDPELQKLLQEAGALIESAGRILKRKPALTLDDLTHIQHVFRHADETLQSVKSTIISQNS